MHGFLLEQVWDNFFLIEGTVRTFADFSLDGRRNRDWFDPEELEVCGEDPYIRWSEARGAVCQWIRGHKTPLAFQFTLALDVKRMRENTVFDLSDRLYIHLRFENGTMYCVTGTARQNFTLDKTAEREWDRLAALFLRKNGIAFEG